MFIGGKQITDEIVVLNEVIEEAKKRKRSSPVFKINFAKVYDSVDWAFLEEMMIGMNFCSNWRRWVMEYETYAST